MAFGLRTARPSLLSLLVVRPSSALELGLSIALGAVDFSLHMGIYHVYRAWRDYSDSPSSVGSSSQSAATDADVAHSPGWTAATNFSLTRRWSTRHTNSDRCPNKGSINGKRINIGPLSLQKAQIMQLKGVLLNRFNSATLFDSGRIESSTEERGYSFSLYCV